jgi:flavin prenyltransferase
VILRSFKQVRPVTGPRRIVVGITGASGTVYGVRLLQVLRQVGVETHLVVSRAGGLTVAYESPMRVPDVRALADCVYSPSDVGAAIASGSSVRWGW